MQVTYLSPSMFAFACPSAKEIQGLDAAVRGHKAQAERIFAEVIKDDPTRQIPIDCMKTLIGLDKRVDLTRFTPLSEARRREDEAADLNGCPSSTDTSKAPSPVPSVRASTPLPPPRSCLPPAPQLPEDVDFKSPPRLPVEVKEEQATAVNMQSGLRRRRFNGNEYVELRS